uniref:Uncharacterized protein n=1 Tax=Onchocerca volvulus TaxID=6282 RepID=A0A8R1TN21_ONCVO
MIELCAQIHHNRKMLHCVEELFDDVNGNLRMHEEEQRRLAAKQHATRLLSPPAAKKQQLQTIHSQQVTQEKKVQGEKVSRNESFAIKNPRTSVGLNELHFLNVSGKLRLGWDCYNELSTN